MFFSNWGGHVPKIPKIQVTLSRFQTNIVTLCLQGNIKKREQVLGVRMRM